MAEKEGAGARRSGVFGAARRALAAWRRLAPFFAASRGQVVTIAVVSVVAGLAEAGLLALVAALALSLSEGEETVRADLGPVALDSPLDVALVVALVLALVRGALQLWLAYLPAAISASAMVALRRRLFDAFVGATWAVKAAERDGQFQTFMNVHVNQTTTAIIQIASVVTNVLMFLSLLLSAVALSPVAAAVLSVASLGLFLALRPLAGRLRRYARELSDENVEYANGVQGVAATAEEMQVFGASPRFVGQFYALLEDVRRPLLRSRFLVGALPSLYQSVALLLLVVALAVVSSMDVGQMTTLGAVVLMLVRALSYGQRVQYSVTGIDEKLPFMDHLAGAIETYRANRQVDGGRPLAAVERIGMRDVRFGYEPGTQVLHGLTFEVRRGEVVGIVGPSGAGKSSLVQLLLRLREPTAGVLTVNGEDAWQVDRAQWQRRVAYVPQQTQLVYGTVADNIRFYREDLTDAQVEQAARWAHVHEEVLTWPEGYATTVGRRAQGVSGGQRQRLAIARALAAEPEVLVLDEPTSALDVRSEELVQETIRGLRGRATVFLVAHRLSTLSVCDRVMVVRDGQIEMFDTPARVLAGNDFFQEVHAITRRQAVVDAGAAPGD